MNAPESRINIAALRDTVQLAAGEQHIDILPDGKGGLYHLVLLPGDKSGTWKAMKKWAEELGGDLPDRVEQALLFRDHKAKFQEDWYWSNARRADDADCAWFQDFGNGSQHADDVSVRYRARAVRRVPIS